MLRGMVIENLLKAHWLKRGNHLSVAGAFQAIPSAGSHNLQQIAQATGFAVSATEGDVLRRLSHFIEYGGRYPIPKSPQKLMLSSAPGGGKTVATSWSTPSDDQCVEGLLLRLDQALK